MGDVVALKRKAGAYGAGVLIAIAAYALMFGSLLFVFAFVRLTGDPWPPEGTPPLPRGAGAVGLGGLLVGAGALALGARALTAPARGRAGALFALGVAGLCAHVAAQGPALLLLRASGFGGAYGTLFLVALFFHLGATVTAFPALALLIARALLPGGPPPLAARASAWALYAGFLGAVWALLYGLLYWV